VKEKDIQFNVHGKLAPLRIFVDYSLSGLKLLMFKQWWSFTKLFGRTKTIKITIPKSNVIILVKLVFVDIFKYLMILKYSLPYFINKVYF